jgi:hypothetical protein
MAVYTSYAEVPWFRYVSLILLIALQGCTTLSDSKTIVVAPDQGQRTVYVESLASSSCWDFFGILNCDLKIDLHQVHK